MAIDSRYKLKTGEEVAYFPPIQNTDNPYLDEAAMHADQANQLQGYGYLVDGVGAFIYLGTVAGTAEDYGGFMPTKDITLRSDNTASTIYFHDALDHDLLYAFIRYNASNNYLEFGSNDNNGLGDVVSAQIDRGKRNWEFKDCIIINMPGRGVRTYAPGGGRYEIRTNDGGVLELWSVNGSGNLETLVWSSASGGGNREFKEITDNPYIAIESDKNKFLVGYNANQVIEVSSSLMDYADKITGWTSGILEVITRHGPSNIGEPRVPEGSINKVKRDGSYTLTKATYDPNFALTGDLVKEFEVVASPDGTLWKKEVDNSGVETITAL